MNGDNLNPYAILNLTDWASLENADGSAFPDTPAKLRDLSSGDFPAVTSSLDHLYSALLNDGVVYSATVPAFRYVAALLGDQPSRAALTPPWEGGKFPLRGKLLTWLANVAFDVSIGQEQRIREWGKYSPTEPFPDFAGIRDIYPEAFPGVASYFDDSDSRVVEAALVAAVRFLESPALAIHRGRLTPLVENVLAQSSNELHRSLASEALNAWRQGRMLIESDIDPLPSGECGRVHDSQEDRGSFDEPPF
ncbi:hypothetical protein [Streptomyces sp. SKN60]|uniref:hypothetical protein n=1 Tax=Streptomyces sp. SKN60 TaxID=2855506 RepID=UPI00224715B9|nr:hypothetical protein [Streptomyces sp. SKN60]